MDYCVIISNFLRKIYYRKIIMSMCFCLFFSSCSQLSQNKKIKIASSPMPHSEILELVKEELEKQGVILDIIRVEDYNIPNKLLADHQIDANFFQHTAYLQDEIKSHNYNFSILTSVHIEPLGIFSKKIKNLEEINKDFSSNMLVIAVPNDKSNEHRALNFLRQLGIVCVKESFNNSYLTSIDVEGCSKKVKILEVDATILSRCLSDVDLAVIPANVALLTKLNPETDALELESGNDSMYANVIVIRKDDLDKSEFLILKKVISNDYMKQRFRDLYKNQSLKFL